MNKVQNNEALRESRRLLPFFVEFVKFSSAFAAIIAVALLTLRIATAAQ